MGIHLNQLRVMAVGKYVIRMSIETMVLTLYTKNVVQIFGKKGLMAYE